MAEDTMSGATPAPVSGADIRTFLFADFRGYTRYTQEHGDEAASALASRFAELVRATVPEFEGELLELRGDEALCVFRSARQALRASVELQRRLRTATDDEPPFPIGVGIGLDAGEAVPTEGGYRGTSLNLAARLCALAKPGEILATETVARFAHRVDGLRLLEGHSATLKGMARPVRYVVVAPEPPLPPLPVVSSGRPRSRWVAPLAIAGVVMLVAASLGVILSQGGTKPQVGLPGGVFAVIASNGHATAPVSVGGGATGVAVAGSVAWVPDYPTGQVLKVDTRTGASVPITVGTGPDAVAVGPGAVWVANAADGTVSEVSPAAAKVVSKPIYVGNGPSGIVVADKAVWVTLALDGAVAKIDPRSGRVVHTFSAGDDPTRITFGFGRLWVTNESVGTVTPIDPKSDRVGTPIAVGGGPNGIAVGAGGVFVTNSSDGTVTRIDPNTTRVAWTNPAGSDPEGVAVVGGSLWVAAHASGAIMRLDARTGRLQSPLTVGADPLNVAAVGNDAAVTTTAAVGGHRGGTLTIAAGPLDRSVDPQSAMAFQAQPWETLMMTNDGLDGFKRVPGPDGETVVADLAMSLPAPAGDGRTYTFQLRRGIRYSTGQVVRASDIRYGIEWAFAINTGAPEYFPLGTMFFDDIVGAKACEKNPTTCDLSHGIVADNATGRITFHLIRADPDFLAKLAMPIADAVPPQVPRHDSLGHPLPATGPYMITRYEPGKVAILVRNPHFKEWSRDAQPAGYPDKIAWRVYRNGDQAALAVEHGRADWLFDSQLSPGRLRQIVTNYAAQVHITSELVTQMIVLAGSSVLQGDLTARRAIAYATDRAKLVNALGGPLAAQPTCQLIPPSFPGYRPYCPYTINPSRTWTAPDLAKAMTLARHSKSYGKTIRVQTGTYASAYLVHLLDTLGFKAKLVGSTATNAVWAQIQGEDYPGADDFIGGWVPTPQLNQHDINELLSKQRESQYAGTLAWSAADRRFTNYLWVMPVATPLTLGFVAKRVGNYLSAPLVGTNPQIDQMWVR